MKSDSLETGPFKRAMNWMTGSSKPENQFLELIDNRPDTERPNRLCVCLSDIHLTDGTVGFQNLKIKNWDAFYDAIKSRCKEYGINELVFVLDGDFIDMIRTDKWAVNGIYPWERDRKKEFSDTVLLIIKSIIKEHEDFFDWLKALPEKIERDCQTQTKIVITLGNHDKELFVDPVALAYFYQHGLGMDPHDPTILTPEYRIAIGKMYGDADRFTKPGTVPYFPFYYGDCGFRLFTTHGQWRDAANSKAVPASSNHPGWKAADGWQMKTWQAMDYEPFFAPCFGDTVAAGVLSTFIYKVKKQLKQAQYENPELIRIMDELDLYRPTYGALIRIIDETHSMQSKNTDDKKAVKIIQDTLYECIMNWLSWDYTYESSPWTRRTLLKIAKQVLELSEKFGHGLEIRSLEMIMKSMTKFETWNPYKKTGEKLKVMRTFPAFLPEYGHYNFQIHGEGHTHIPLQEEPAIKTTVGRPCSYINFGTWRNQILLRKGSGYRRRGVLRALFILDIINERENIKDSNKQAKRSFNYLTEDIIHWNDQFDNLSYSRDSLAPNL